MRNKVNLDQTLSYTQSSFTYKDPYQINGNLLYKTRSKVFSFFAMRNVENEFVDFKGYNIDRQFREVYGDIFLAYKRGDKVTLQRSLSEAMFAHTTHLLKAKKDNPFLKDINSLSTL